jgi:hypothetical protein
LVIVDLFLVKCHCIPMKLVTTPEWLGDVPSTPPNYDYSRIVPVEGVSLRHINIRHFSDGELPDYLAEVLAETDVFAPELPGWDDWSSKRVQKIANGDYKALQQIKGSGDRAVPEAAAYNNFVMGQLFNSKVKVAFVDVKRGSQGFRRIEQLMSRPTTEMLRAGHIEREQFVLESLCERLRDYRRNTTGELRVAMTFGVMHMAMADGYNEAARVHGVEDTSAVSEYEDVFSHMTSELDQASAQILLDYQSWLRESTETDL